MTSFEADHTNKDTKGTNWSYLKRFLKGLE